MNYLLRNTFLVMSFILLSLGIIFQNPIVMLYALLFIFIHNMLYGIEKFYTRIIFIVFNITFFVFLIGRMIVNFFFNYKVTSNGLLGTHFVEVEILVKIILILFLSLFFIFIGFKFNEKKLSNLFLSTNIKNSNEKFIKSLRLVSFTVFFIAFYYKMLYWKEAIVASRTSGYFEYFSTFQSSLPKYQELLGDMLPVAFFFYLATFPNRQKLILPIFLYILEGGISMLTGSRSGFMLNILIVFIYLCLRSKEAEVKKLKKWVSSKEIVFILFSIPFLSVLLNLIEQMRNKHATSTDTISQSILEFFYSQGVSVNIIGYTLEYSDKIPYKIYTIGPIIEFIKFNIWNKLIGDYHSFSGQSVERALDGYQYSHTMSYLIMPNLYLKGVGYGSSFTAEMFHDFSFIGLIIGSLLIGVFISLLTLNFSSNNILLILFTLLITRTILFIPRASSIAFVIDTFSPINILTILIILFLTFLLANVKRFKVISSEKVSNIESS